MLRFKNDDGSEFPEWEEHEIAELIQLYNEKVSSDCQLPILTSSKKNGIEYQEEHFTGKQRHDIEGYNVLPRNYCTYRNRSDGTDFTFNINKLCDKGIVSKFYPVFKEKDCDLFFLVSLLNNERKTVRKIAYTAKGTGQKVLSITDLRNITVNMPSLPEQQKIADFLSTIDTVIAKQKETVSAWEERKKGVMQKLFSQEVRFKADDGSDFPEWEEKKLGDITSQYKVRNKKRLPLKIYSVNNIVGFIPQSEQFDDAGYLKDTDTSIYMIVPPKHFAYNPARLDIGSIGYQYLDHDVQVSSLYEVFETSDLVNDNFLWSWFHTHYFNNVVKRLQEGGVRLYFYYDKMQEVKIELPSLPEQQKIADCLSSLDEVIEKQKATLAAWEEMKKGLLQQMFV